VAPTTAAGAVPTPTDTATTSLADAVQIAERAAIERALAGCAGNLARTAAALGIERNTLKRKLRVLGLYRAPRR
jgi:two-component system, NtrC family, response regulator AtoC